MRPARVLLDSLLLLAGTGAAVVWANLDFQGDDGAAHPLHFVVNDIGTVFFFALAAKEVFEATLPGGALASPRRALAPLSAATGGMVLLLFGFANAGVPFAGIGAGTARLGGEQQPPGLRK
jgi:Na+/H+ antiporter NhaA